MLKGALLALFPLMAFSSAVRSSSGFIAWVILGTPVPKRDIPTRDGAASAYGYSILKFPHCKSEGTQEASIHGEKRRTRGARLRQCPAWQPAANRCAVLWKDGSFARDGCWRSNATFHLAPAMGLPRRNAWVAPPSSDPRRSVATSRPLASHWNYGNGAAIILSVLRRVVNSLCPVISPLF
jgi:hypothetical protein